MEIERASVLFNFQKWLEGKHTPPPPVYTISPNTPNRNCEIDILSNVIERSRNYVFKDDKPPTAFRARVISFVLGAYKVYIKMVIVKTFWMGSLNWKSDVLVPFFKIQSDQWSDFPHISCFPETNLMEILRWPFVVVETSKRPHSIGMLKGLVLFLIFKSDLKGTNPPSTRIISRNPSNPNC